MQKATSLVLWKGHGPHLLLSLCPSPVSSFLALTCSPLQMLWDLFPDSAPSILYHVLPRVCSRKQGSLTSPAQGVTGLVPDAGALD